MNIDQVKFVDASPVVERIKRSLSGLKYKEVLTTAQLAEVLGISYGRLKAAYTADPALTDYRLKVKLFDRSNQVVWGSKKTIEELKRRVQQ